MIGKKINQLATELAPVSTDLTIIGDPISGVSKKITLAQLGAIFSGAVSFYTDLASFPATGDINVIYCAKDTKKLYLWSGSAYTEVFPSQALLDTYQLRSEKGNANGYASLDGLGKVPISQLPSSLMEYKGTWNASTNTPTLANGTGDTGDVYICNVAGTVNFGAGPISFAVGDYTIYSGSIWQRSSGAVGTVTSVAVSRSGDALAITGSPITTSGTINIGFAGNSTQYINGAGNLVTFPGVINEAQNLITEVYNKTGATLTKGTIVYINGGQGNLPTITKALATGDSTSAQTYGIVRNDITNNNNGYVVVAGRISDLDTQAYTEGTQLYLSPTTAGTWTSTKPYAPQHLVYVGIVVRAHPTQGVIEVKIQNGYELDELHNVAAQTPTNNDGLFWEASTSLWKNKSIATILGYTPQAQLNGTGFVKASGTTISYDNSTYVTIDTFETITASKNFAVGLSLGSAGGTNQASVFQNTSSLFSGSAGVNVFGFNSANNIYFGKGSDNGGVLQWSNSTVRYYTLPDATGTIALVGGSGVGTVTSVSALTIGTSGTDITSTVANSTTTPVITLNVPTASATNRGALSSADWTKFNNNIPAGTPTSGDYVFYNGSNLAYRNFIANAPLSYNSSTATFSISQASGSANGFLSSTDWTTFNNKQNALTNPVTGTGTTNYLPKFTGASTIGNSAVFESSGNVGIGTITPTSYGAGYTTLAVNNTSGGVIDLMVNGTRNGTFYNSSTDVVIGTIGSIPLNFRTNNTERMRLDASGNLGLGVTPSAWGNAAGFLAFEMPSGNINSYGADWLIIAQNSYSNSSGTRIYKNTGFASEYIQTSSQHRWYTAPSGTAGNAISFTQAMTLFANGNLGLGTTSISNPVGFTRILNVSAYDSALVLSNTGGTAKNWTIGAIDNGTLGIFDGSSARLTIASTGAATFSSSVTAGGDVNIPNGNYYYAKRSTGGANIGVLGFASGSDTLTIKGGTSGASNSINFEDTGGVIASFYAGRLGIGTTSPAVKLEVNGEIRLPNNTFLQAKDTSTGWIEMVKGDASNNTVIANNKGASIVFSNDVSNERMRITSGGSVCIGVTSPTNSQGIFVYRSNFAAAFQTDAGTGQEAIRFFNGSTAVGTIATTSSSTAYNTSSDYRLKQDFKDFNGLDLLTKIKTYDYEWKADKTRSYGVIAHELQSVINYAVTGVKDGKEMQGVDYSKIVPVLIKAIQELNDKIK